MRAVKVIDAICIILFVFMGIYIFALPEGAQDQIMPVFTIINPYQTGAWIMGIGFLVTCLWGKSRTGLVLGIVLLACYLITAFVSLVGLIVITSGLDLLWYLHPILVVISCIAAIYRRKKANEIFNNKTT
ncbi:MAG: hypothetical protein Q4D99_03550 [Bacillota bacterium]|nr:hypothetical protein [Bacillota bacterium]